MKRRIIIVGSGAAGGTLARELSKKAENQVVIIEQGKTFNKVGSIFTAIKFYEHWGLLKSRKMKLTWFEDSLKEVKGDIIIYRAIMAGGTTMVSCGNAMRSKLLQEKFLEFDIDLEPYYIQAEKELGVNFLRQTETANLITRIGERIGYNFVPIPKMVKNCHYCGHCELGCKFGAKWTALNSINEAVKNGAKLITKTKVVEVLEKNGVAGGVLIYRSDGTYRIESDIVILTAGGIGTPRILANSEIFSADVGLFCDLFHVTYGIMDKAQNLGHNMPTIYYGDGFILSPFIDSKIHLALIAKSCFQHCFQHQKLLGIMTKIADFKNGQITNDAVIKCTLEEDQEKLDRGFAIARQILLRAGAKSIMVTPTRGAHPGGTVVIGRTVDENLQTKNIKNLFVCDASVLPVAPGMPPILTIVALAKWLADRL